MIAPLTSYDSKKDFLGTSAVEAVIKLVLKVNQDSIMVIKSTIPVGYVEDVRKKYNTRSIIFSPEFLRESKVLYDSLYPSRITEIKKRETYAKISLPVSLCRQRKSPLH